MTLTRWYIGKGPSHAMSYLLDVLPSGEVLWTDDRDAAHRFDRREDAAMVALHVAHADPRATVATVPDDRKAEQQLEAQRQHAEDRARFDSAIADLHVAGALTRRSIAAVNAVAEW